VRRRHDVVAARADGYATAQLDSTRFPTEALALYAAMRFDEVPPSPGLSPELFMYQAYMTRPL